MSYDNLAQIEDMVEIIANLRYSKGRLFILGVGGSAANASHAVNDFRKICNIEAYAPTDNVSELTARTNDEGWASTFESWLKGSRLDVKDVVMILSVGGGDEEKNVSPNLVQAIKYAKQVGSFVVGIVGRDGGYTAKAADACVIIPTVNKDRITPYTEAFQAVIWHLITSHPSLKVEQTKWESVPEKKNQTGDRAVFFDRDGTLTDNPYPPIKGAIPTISIGAQEALFSLKERGFKTFIVTNQPDIARGTLTVEDVCYANAYLATRLLLDWAYFCGHDDKDECKCRKPRAGMLLDAAKDFRINLSKSFIVGDRVSDIVAGEKCRL